MSKNCNINAAFEQKASMIAQLIFRYCICIVVKTNTSDKKCTEKPLIWDQDELSRSSGSRVMRSSFVSVVNNHTVSTSTSKFPLQVDLQAFPLSLPLTFSYLRGYASHLTLLELWTPERPRKKKIRNFLRWSFVLLFLSRDLVSFVPQEEG